MTALPPEDGTVGAGWTRCRLTAASGGFAAPDLGVWCWESGYAAAGPTVVVLGGVHGDELEGVVAAGSLPRRLPVVRRGRLRVVPLCSEAAFAAGTRTSPADHTDLARTFPGSPAGTATQRLAALLTEQVLSDADCLVDLHTAGSRYDMPPLIGYVDDGGRAAVEAAELARQFGAPFIWRHPSYSLGRATSVVGGERGRPALYAECPGGQQLDLEQVDSYVAGLTRILVHFGLLDGPAPALPNEAPVLVTGGGNLDRDVVRSPAAGLFVRQAGPGSRVGSGEAVGTLVDASGRLLDTVRSPADGRVMFIRRRAQIAVGEVVACVADAD